MKTEDKIQKTEAGITAGRCWLRPIEEDDFARLKELASADNHAVIAPTHVFEKIHGDGSREIVGYASIAAVALVLPWFSTKSCKARDSIYFINQMENLVANMLPANGPGLLAVPVVKGSPFEPVIEKLGYLPVGETILTLKKVKG